MEIYEIFARNTGKSIYERGFRYGYIKGIEDLINRMDNGDLDDYVDPYEIGGFMLCLKKTADALINQIKL